MKIRVVKTASGASAVQVVRYKNNKRVVLKHIGSAHTGIELEHLKQMAEEWMKCASQQLSIFPEEDSNQLLSAKHCTFIGVKYLYFYRLIQRIQGLIGIEGAPTLLQDLITIRILEPASKLRSIELIEQYFGIRHNRKTFYKIAPQCIDLKHAVQRAVLSFAREHYAFSFDMLFYDVTTLYFETFEEDGLRKNGFSKDNKPQQPQILVALMVSREGFPVDYEIFSGNTFEGHTIIPVIRDFVRRNGVKSFTVVADAAMISQANIEALDADGIDYIVGARLGSLPAELHRRIDSAIQRVDGCTIRLETSKGGLICSYSSSRHRKDLYEMEKQVEKARRAVENPSQQKRLKFVRAREKGVELNQELIERTKKLLGIKGYYTSLKEEAVSNEVIMSHYHELYRIEQAFRVSKSDLETRPVYHFKEQPIKLHMLICFVALAISKHIELKTGLSIKRFKDELRKVADALILNSITGKIIVLEGKPSEELKKHIEKIFSPH